MPLPVIANTFQCVFNWTNPNAPRDAANIVHFHDVAGGQSESDLNTDISANVSAIMWQSTTASGWINALRITHLDGVSAGQTFPHASAAKWIGGGGADCILQGCQVVSLKSAQRGPRGRNRVFLPWISEDRQVNGVVDAGITSNINGAWGTFAGAMTVAGWGIVAVSAAHADRHDVTNITVSQSLYTQRRRARR